MALTLGSVTLAYAGVQAIATRKPWVPDFSGTTNFSRCPGFPALVSAIPFKPIRNDDDLTAVFRRLEAIFQAGEQTPDADERDVLVTLVEAYENKHFDFGPADPVEAIKFRMEQQGLTARDLERFIGPSGRVSEVLNRKRPLSLAMIRRLHDGLKIPYESLLAEAG